MPQGTRVAYSRLGAGSPIVRTPPWLSHLDGEWQTPPIRRFYESIAEHHTLIRYDSPGFGLSDWTRSEFSGASELATLEMVVDRLDLDRFALFGYDAGGQLAIAYAARHPERVSALILFGTFADSSHLEAGQKIPEALRTLIKDHWDLASRLVADLHAPDADGATLQMIAAMYRQASTGENIIKAISGLIYGTDVTDLLPRLNVPTTVIHRIDDPASPYQAGRELASRIPQGFFVPLAGSTHLPYLGDSDAVLAAIARALGDEYAQSPSAEKDPQTCASCGAQDAGHPAVVSTPRVGAASEYTHGDDDSRADDRGYDIVTTIPSRTGPTGSDCRCCRLRRLARRMAERRSATRASIGRWPTRARPPG
ncbi:MAG: alpha/beta fold hydrolase [Candidatus Binataceae bacterium]